MHLLVFLFCFKKLRDEYKFNLLKKKKLFVVCILSFSPYYSKVFCHTQLWQSRLHASFVLYAVWWWCHKTGMHTHTHTHSLNPSRSLEDYKTFHCLFLHPYPCLSPLLFITTSVFMFWMQPLLDFKLHFLCSEMKSVLILQSLSLFLKVLYVWGSLHNHIVALIGVNFALFVLMRLYEG